MTSYEVDILKYFEGLKFDPELHTYCIEGKPLSGSVSNIVGSFPKKVNFKLLAEKIDIRDGLPLGTTSSLWKKTSKEAARIGTQAHSFGEKHLEDKLIPPSNGYEQAIVHFWKEVPPHIIPSLSELKMYHKKYFFGGTKDKILFNSKSGNFISLDYKVTKDLWKNYKGARLKAPFSHLLDNAFNKYQIQLGLYQILFEQTGYKIERRLVVNLKPDGNYEMYDTEDLTNILETYLAKLSKDGKSRRTNRKGILSLL